MPTKTTDHTMSMIGNALAELQTLDPLPGTSFYDVVPQLFLQDGGWTWVRQWPSGGYSVIFHGTLPQIRAKIGERITDAKTRKYRATCQMFLDWIDNLIRKYGEEAILDALPNNTGGACGSKKPLTKSEDNIMQYLVAVCLEIEAENVAEAVENAYEVLREPEFCVLSVIPATDDLRTKYDKLFAQAVVVNKEYA